MQISKKNLFTVAIFVISLASVFSVSSITIISIGNTTVWWLSYAFLIAILFLLIYTNSSFKKIKENKLIPVVLLVIWFIVCFVRGTFIADNYWQWKNLIQVGFTFMLPCIVFVSIYPSFFSFVFNKWLNTALLFFVFVVLVLTDDGDGSGRYLAPISILTLFFSVVSNKYKIILLGISMYVILDNFDARSNVIKFIIPIVLACGIYFRIYQRKFLMRSLMVISFCLPIVLFVFAVFGFFNVFKMNEYITKSDNVMVKQNGREVNLTVDTRTFLYNEVVSSAIKHKYVLFGRTPARGNDSESFGYLNENIKLNNIERFANEVSILNIFTWTGLVGVFLYGFVFLRAAYLAVFDSNNYYSVLLGIYISFRWVYGWIEDFTNFDLFYLTLWMTIGLCFSTTFRKMTNSEIEKWIRNMIKIKVF